MTLRSDSIAFDDLNHLLILLRGRWNRLVKHSSHREVLGYLLSFKVSLQQIRAVKRFATP